MSKQIKRDGSFTRDTRLDEEVQLWLSPELPKASDRAIDAQTASYDAQEQMMPPSANTTEDQRGFRLDVPLHALLTQPAARSLVAPVESPQRLPEAAFPQHPELLGDDGSGPPVPPPKRQYKAEQITRALRGWAVPWLKSRVLPGDFHPIIAYLFTEWKCNLDCHYCWAFDKSVQRPPRTSIDVVIIVIVHAEKSHCDKAL